MKYNTGMKFNSLTLIRKGEPKLVKGRPGKFVNVSTWWVKCDCGTEKLLRQNQLKYTKTCGCKGRVLIDAIKTYKKEYCAWQNMKARCDNVNHPEYVNYGGRGVTYCDAWKHFHNFIKDVKKAPDKYCILDRENVEGNYEPGNVRWVNTSLSAYNKRQHPNNTSGITGVAYNKRKDTYMAYINKDSKRKYLGTYKTKQEAVEARLEAERNMY